MILLVIFVTALSLVESQPPQYRCNTDGRWPEYLYLVNDTCLRCPSTCESCLPETADLDHPCRTCFVGHGFEPSPSAKQILDSSNITAARLAPSDWEGDSDKVLYNETEAEVGDPFTWFVSGSCADCHTIGKYPSSGSHRLHLSPASLSMPYEGRLEMYYYNRWWAVCDDLWNLTNTHIACAELGLGLGVSFSYNYYSSSPQVAQLGPIPIAFDNIECDREETSLFRCRRSQFLKHNCDVSETLGIKCSGPRHRSMCVSECPVGQWLDSHPGVCKNCSDNCLTCQSHPTICTSCEEPYFLATNSTCLHHCPWGYYGHTVKHTCEPCSRNCETCAEGRTDNACVSCARDLVLYKGRCDAHCPGKSFWLQKQQGASCIDVCPHGYYPTKAFVCQPCDANCQTCHALPTNCTKCNLDLVLSIRGSDGAGQEFGECNDECEHGYFPNAFGVCEKCAQDVCSECYLGGEYCKTCRRGYLMQFNTCVQKCQYGLFNTGGQCTEYCPVGHFGNFNRQECSPCESPCKFCKSAEICTACFEGFHLNNGECVKTCGGALLAQSVPVASELRIVGMRNHLEGYVQSRSNNVWSYVCFSKLELLTAQFVCEALGLGDVLRISHEGSLERLMASFMYMETECFTDHQSFYTCTKTNRTLYSDCDKQLPLLRCSGPDISRNNQCIRLHAGPCGAEDVCSNLSRCMDISDNGSYSYCSPCPKGYHGDGYNCDEVGELGLSISILFPASDVQLLNWPERVELHLPCVVKDIQHVTIGWLHNGAELHSDADMRLEGRGGLTLFEPVGRGSSGAYTCRVRVHGRVVDTRTYHITVQEKIQIIVPPENYTGSGVVVLNCVYTGFPPANIYWTKDGSNLSLDDGMSIQASNGSLILSSVRPHHSGVYQCTARNSFTQDQAQATVTVTGQPVIVNKRSEVGAALGEQFILVCMVSGGPDPDIYWKKDGSDIHFNSRVQFVDNGSIMIHEVQHRDAGLYKCIARNMFGEDIWTTTLIVMEHPNASVSPIYIEDVLGSRVTFLCEASPREPAPLITWSLPARGEVVETNDTLGVEMFDGRIIIADLQEEDAGFVVCRVSNLAGYFEVRAQLLIKVPPRFIQAPQNSTVFGGWPSHLDWTVYAIPPAVIAWYHSGRQFSDNNGVHINTSGLYFSPSWPHSAGWYTIRATHQVGYLLESAYVHVIKNIAPVSGLFVTETTIDIPLESALGEGLAHDYAEILMAYLGNSSQYQTVDVSPYEVNVRTCRNHTACSEPYSLSQSLYRVGIVDSSTSHFMLGDHQSYFLEGDTEQVHNQELVRLAWYAVSVRYFTTSGVDLSSMIAATEYSYVFTENSQMVGEGSGIWKTVVAVVVTLVCLLFLCVLALWILHNKGYSPPHGFIPQRLLTLCHRKQAKIDLDGPIDVESYLPQFSPHPSPALITATPSEAMPSTSYIPTEHEINQIMGVDYYDDVRWMKRLANDEPSTSKEMLSSDANITPKPVQDTTDSTAPRSHHSTVVHKLSSGSKDSGSDSGFNETVPRKVSLSTKRGSKQGETLAREVVSISNLRHHQSTDRSVENKSTDSHAGSTMTKAQQMTPVNKVTRLHNLKLRLSRASGYMASGVMRIRDRVTASRKSVTLVNYGHNEAKNEGSVSGVVVAREERDGSRQVIDSSVAKVTRRSDSHMSGMWAGTVEGVGTTQVIDGSIAKVTRRRGIPCETDSPTDSDDEYIDPRSISSIPPNKVKNQRSVVVSEKTKVLHSSSSNSNFKGSLSDIPWKSDLGREHDTFEPESCINNDLDFDDFNLIYEINKQTLLVEEQASSVNVLDVNIAELAERQYGDHIEMDDRELNSSNSQYTRPGGKKLGKMPTFSDTMAMKESIHFKTITELVKKLHQPTNTTHGTNEDGHQLFGHLSTYETTKGVTENHPDGEMYAEHETQECQENGIYEQLEGMKGSGNSSHCVLCQHEADTSNAAIFNGDVIQKVEEQPSLEMSSERIKPKLDNVGSSLKGPDQSESEQRHDITNSPVRPLDHIDKSSTDADEILEAFNAMLTRAEHTESPRIRRASWSSTSVALADDQPGTEDMAKTMAFHRVENVNVEVKSDNSSASHVYTELIPEPSPTIAESQDALADSLNINDHQTIEMQISQENDESSIHACKEGAEQEAAKDMKDCVEQKLSEIPAEKKDDDSIDEQNTSFLKDEPVRLYYALFPDKSVPILSPTVEGNRENVATITELNFEGHNEVFSVVIPEERVVMPNQNTGSNIVQSLDLGGKDSCEFLSTFARITKNTAVAETDQRKKGGTKSYIYGGRTASRLYPSHTDSVEQIKDDIKEGNQFVMSDTYKNKPPQKLDIPDIFQK